MDNDNTFTYVNNEDNNDEKVINQDDDKHEETVEAQAQAFVTGLPDWDLTPPYEVVRRVNR